MKTKHFIIALTLSLFLLISCMPSSSSSSNNDGTGTKIIDPEAPQDPEDPQEPDPTADSEPSAVQLAIKTPSSLFFFDGVTFTEKSNASPIKCGPKCYTNDNLVHQYDNLGSISATFNLITRPDFIVRSDDTYIIEKITPAEAFAMGAQARNFTRVWNGTTEIGNWFLNEFETGQVKETLSGDIFLINTTGSYHHISETISGVNHADQLIIHTFDAVGRTAYINDGLNHFVNWSTNYFGSAKEWQEAEGVWYSGNGYVFVTGVLIEDANELWKWNSADNSDYIIELPYGQSPVIISAGTREENSETVLYWIEANTGWLTRYIPSVDRNEAAYRLYAGDGDRMTGIANAATLKNVLIGDFLYFSNDGCVWKLSLVDGTIVIFYGGEGFVEAF